MSPKHPGNNLFFLSFGCFSLRLPVPSWRENHIEPLAEDPSFDPPEVRLFKRNIFWTLKSTYCLIFLFDRFFLFSWWTTAHFWNATQSWSWTRREGKGTNNNLYVVVFLLLCSSSIPIKNKCLQINICQRTLSYINTEHLPVQKDTKINI